MIIENLRTRIMIIIGVLIAAMISTTPNFFEVGEGWWFSQEKITYGLDIQGGLHLVLGVDVEGVVKETATRLSTTLEKEVKEEGITIQGVKVTRPELGEMEFTMASGAEVTSLSGYIENRYQSQLQILSSSENTLVVRYFDQYIREYKKRVVEQSIETIRNRIDEFGVAEPSITAQGTDRILVQLPGIKDASRAKSLINTTARLEFMMVSQKVPGDKLSQMIADAEKKGDYNLSKMRYSEYIRKLNEDLKPALPEKTMVLFEKSQNAESMEAGKVPYLVKTNTDLGGDDLKDAFVSFDEFGVPQVSLEFNAIGGKKFSDLTGSNVNELMAIVLDRVIKSAPVIQGRIPGGRGVITLGRSRDRNQMTEEAKMISMSLRAGALPAELQQLEERTVGPTLGADSIARGKKAGIIGGILVLIFMIFYYKAFGVIADIALSFNILILLAVLTSLGATLTLPGVAGIVLTVGMAVDANVIIFERIKEELSKGSGMMMAIKEGYSRAFSAIFDANITTAAVCVVLMYYGSGPVRGFAVTLMIGIFTSMFTAIFFTRGILDLLLVQLKVKKLAI